MKPIGTQTEKLPLAQTAYLCGVDLFLEKPLQTDRVLEIVKQLLPAPSAQAAARNVN